MRTLKLKTYKKHYMVILIQLGFPITCYYLVKVPIDSENKITISTIITIVSNVNELLEKYFLTLFITTKIIF